jgi:pSer/pThr/pTyr-binding forkhead associated (FHA) protein
MPELIIQERGGEPFVHEMSEGEVALGRHDDNTIQLRSGGVSRRHAKIFAEDDHFFLTDLKSGNGTFLNGIRVAPYEKNLLRAGDIITIDTFDIRFHIGESGEAMAIEEEITDSDVLEVKLLKKVLTALDKETVPSLEVLNGSAEGKKVFLTDDASEITVGRDPECEFPINEYVISRHHAKIQKRWGGISIRDLESKNGTFVNNKRIVEEFLHDGDRVALGTIVCLFRNPQEINLAQLEDVRPRVQPAPVLPHEIPGLEASADAEAVPGEFPGGAEFEAPPEEAAEMAEGSEAVRQWERLEQAAPQTAYPMPQPRIEAIKQFSPVEIGMIGLGVLVLIFAIITIVNLLAS